MKCDFVLRYPNGLPSATAQQKGETIRYKIVKGKKVPYVQHYTKPKVEAAQLQFMVGMKPHRPKKPMEGPIRVYLWICFNVKDKKLWGRYKTTKVDVDNYSKLILDCMTKLKFWNDDAQVADLRVVKTYAEQGALSVHIEELENIKEVIT